VLVLACDASGQGRVSLLVVAEERSLVLCVVCCVLCCALWWSGGLLGQGPSSNTYVPPQLNSIRKRYLLSQSTQYSLPCHARQRAAPGSRRHAARRHTGTGTGEAIRAARGTSAGRVIRHSEEPQWAVAARRCATRSRQRAPCHCPWCWCCGGGPSACLRPLAVRAPAPLARECGQRCGLRALTYPGAYVI
jgi:hypothetical protein